MCIDVNRYVKTESRALKTFLPCARSLSTALKPFVDLATSCSISRATSCSSVLMLSIAWLRNSWRRYSKALRSMSVLVGEPMLVSDGIADAPLLSCLAIVLNEKLNSEIILSTETQWNSQSSDDAQRRSWLYSNLYS